MPNNIKLLKWSELFSRSLPTDKSVAILTQGDVTAQDRTDLIDALNLDQTSITPALKVVNDNYSASFADTYILAGGEEAFTITLPKASVEANKIGGVIYIKNDADIIVTIEPASGDSIWDYEYIDLNEGDSVKLVCYNSAGWMIFSQYVRPA